MSHIIEVGTSQRNDYTITVGRDLWEEFSNFCKQRYPSRKIWAVIDEKVRDLHGREVERNLENCFREVGVIKIPEGETSKSLSRWNKILDRILEGGVERNTPLAAIGGGVTGDLAGFAAASVLRGTPLIHFPTSLLAMVDSSIGGKTGVNHRTGKNLVGSFYQPDAVFADVNFLSTLEVKEWINGLAEILKYGAIRKPELFETVENLVYSGFQANNGWVEVIRECMEIKVDIVEQDTMESGIRAHLNFGHTFGHALERNAGYGTISHGEAVFTGMLAAVYASRQRGAEVNGTPFKPFLPLYNIDFNSVEEEIDRLINLMKRDKKVKDGIVRLILLREWGRPYVDDSNDEQLIRDSWDFAISSMNKEDNIPL